MINQKQNSVKANKKVVKPKVKNANKNSSII